MKKRVFILCLAICVLFAMSSVCASDVNDTAIASQDTMAEVAQSDDLATADEISQTDDGEILPAGKDVETLSAANDLDILGANGTYSELREKIGTGGLIDLDSKTYIYDSGDTIEITEDGTVINGNGAIIDMSKSSIKAFHVTAKNVVFNGLSIINVNFVGSGGAIYFTESGTVMGCNFTDNNASYYGGAVYFAGEGQLLNCNFARNKADNGGAVYFNGNGTVMNCNFDGNKAEGDDGGAIYFGNEVSGCNINATFKENQASRYGGAIYFKEASSNVNIYGEFEKNKADCGGAILFHDGLWVSCTNLFINATFKENEAKRGDFGSDGGAIAFINSGIADSCINSTFIENVAKSDNEYEADGGAINFYAINNVTINGEFKGNSAEYGGAIHCDHEVSNLNVNAIFIDNQATRDGGAIYLSKNSNNVYIGGEFKDNEALNKNGGAINFNGDVSDSTINATFIENKAFDHGGAIYFNGEVSDSNMTSTFKKNVARDNGGAIYFNNTIDNVLIYGEFNDNPADYGGAIYFKEVSDSNIKAIFIGNSVRNDEGAAIYFEGKITNVGISGNYINNTGKSVICIQNAGTGNKIHDSIFLNNNVSEIINVTAGNITVNNNWFGNTVLNYTETPVNVGIELDNWLFLDSKLVPEIKPVGKASDIIFLLKAYDPDSGMSDYDNALLTPLSLKIMVEGGTIPKDRVNLGEAVKYTPTALGTGCATATIDNIQVTVDFTIKTNPDLSLETAQLVYSGNSTIALSYNDTASGKINITLNGKKFNASFTNIDLNKTISLGNINADDYEVTISYSGDNQFAEDVVVKSLKVYKADAEIIISSATLDMKALEYVSAGASLSPAAAGSLNYISNNSKVAVVEAGVIMAISKGTATITVLFAGNDNYRPAEIKNITVNVGLNDASVIVDSPALNLNVGDTYAINATTIPPIIKVFVTYTSSNESVVTVDENGTVTAVGEGNAVITVAIGDDVVYAKNSTAVNVTVQKSKTVINADAVIATYNVDKNLVITLKDAKGNALSNLTISVSLDSTKTYSTDKNGQVIINVAKLVPKTYTAKITFDGNSKYISSSANVTVTVNKAKAKIVAKKKTFKKAKKVKKYAITLKSGKSKISNAKVTLKIKGKKAIKAKTNKKGKATFKIKKLNKKGTYKATIKFKGNAYYTKATKKAKIKIK